MATLWLVLGVLLTTHVSLVYSAKILMYPGFGGSHVLALARLGQELAARNHQVAILVGSADTVQVFPEIQRVTFKVPLTKGFLERFMLQYMKGKGILSLFLTKTNLTLMTMQLVYCEAVLSDSKLMKSLSGFDLIVADRFFVCGALLSASLGIRRIDYGNYLLPHAILPPESIFTYSYIPHAFSRNPSKMTFFQRLKNVLTFCSMRLWIQVDSHFGKKWEALQKKYNITPEMSFRQLLQDVELTLIRSDFAVDIARPIRSDEKIIGSLNMAPARPLSSSLQQDVDSCGDDGFIVVSFGTIITSMLPKEKIDIMAETFKRLKQKVIWKLKGYKPIPLPNNVLILDWLPQNDLLANHNVRAFVSHLGSNSKYEALYHGVPVVAMPLAGDQHDNAVRMEEKGVAVTVDYHNLTVDNFYSALYRVLYDKSFRENSQRISRLMKDRSRLPVEDGADWVEYTLRHKDLSHLRPQSNQLTWYQYFLVDVLVFLVIILVMFLVVIKYIFCLVCRVCCHRKIKKE